MRVFRFTNSVVFGIATLFSMALLLAPYLSPGLILPRTEELNYSLYPLILWAKQLLAWDVPLWFADAGLGVPWPIPHTMSHTPLALFFAILPVYSALAVLLAVHIGLQAFFTVRLCGHFKFTPLTSVAVLLSVLLAAPMEYTVVSDAAAVYMVWTLLPILFFAMLKLLEPSDLLRSLGYASLLALAVGYGILNGHTGVFVTHVLGLGLVVLFQPKSFLARWYWFAFASLLAVGIGSEKIFMLAHEMPYFGNNIPRLQYTFGHNLYYSIWNLFLKPFVPSFQLFSSDYWNALVAQNNISRTITLGSPLCALLMLAYAVSWFRGAISRPDNFSTERAMWLMFSACILLQFIPTSLLPFFVSASWTFRDPAILVGLFLVGILCDNWLRPRLNVGSFRCLLAMHLVLLVVSAVFFQYGSNWRSPMIGELTNVYNSLSRGTIDYPLHQMIQKALDCPKDVDGCDESIRRVVYDGYAANEAHSGSLVHQGLHLNSLPLYGFQDVSFLTKGLSLDAIHPSQSKPYGMVSTLSFANYRYSPDAFDWVKESPALLSLLSIRAVVGREDPKYEANGLTLIGTLDPKAVPPNNKLSVYANPHSFPRAFFIDESYFDSVTQSDGCPQDSNFLTCMNVAAIVESTKPWGDKVGVEETYNKLTLKFPPSLHSRTLLINTLWRPEWQVDGAKLSQFYGLMKLAVPAGSSKVTLHYSPRNLLLARYITLLCFGISLLGCLAVQARMTVVRAFFQD